MNADSGVALDGAQGRRRHGRQRDCSCSSRPTSSACRSSGRRSPRRRALGAAYAAGLAVGFWNGESTTFAQNWAKDKEWTPKLDPAERDREYKMLEEGRDPDVRLGRGRGARARPRVGGAAQPHLTGRVGMNGSTTVDALVIGGGATGAGLLPRSARRWPQDAARGKVRPREPARAAATTGCCTRAAATSSPDPAAAHECADRGTRIVRRIAPACVEDTGGYFVATPDDADDFGDGFAGARARRAKASPVDRSRLRPLPRPRGPAAQPGAEAGVPRPRRAVVEPSNT